MATGWIALRVLHVGCGTFWVGTDLFFTFLLLPQLRGLGPAVERPVITALMRRLPPVMMTTSLLTAITGVWMAVSMQGWNPGWMLESGWGMAMLVGAVGTFITLVIGMGVIPPVTMRYDKLTRSIENRMPTEDEAVELQRLTNRTSRLVHINSGLLIIVVIAMAVARFV